MELFISSITGIINMMIPAVIFLFLNDMIFLSKEFPENDKKSRRLRRKKQFKLILVSPIGLFIILIISILIVETILSAFLVGMGIMEYSGDNTIVPTLSAERGLQIETESYGASNDILLLMLMFSAMIGVPVLMLTVRMYCHIVGCSKRLGIFIYMAVLYMYVASTLITLPINRINPTASSLISSGCFIIMLIIFYLPSADKIQFMRRYENSKLLLQINTLPVINFILLLLLLGFEIMLEQNGYLDMVYYIIILLFAVILYAGSQLAYNILFRHIEESTRIEALTKESLESQEQVTLAFAEITEAKSGQTGQHIKRVSEYSRILAQALGLPRNEVENIRIASMMHDIGKLLIPPEILEKRGRLTDEEFEIMKSHVNIGENLLHNAPGEIMSVARVIAQQHHEWWNGNGYLKMKGEEIDLYARITAVADVYDALTSNRSYKKAWYSSQAYDIIVNESGEHFDPVVVEAFKEHFGEIKAVQDKYSEGVYK
ncbi:MAG: HD-GYP domain-containing protein [Oscillospiraceae bacterium]